MAFTGNTFECSSYKTLVVNFNAPAIPPANGYKVSWRVVGESWIDVPNQFNNPITISNVPTCYNLEVSVQADCGDGNLGTAVIVAVTGVGSNCYNFILLDNGTYFYKPCGIEVEEQIVVNENFPPTICATDGTVRGGSFTRTVQCS